MPDLILHHYPSSPFSEKIRLALGFKKLAWKSVVIPAIMPKPDVLALTGGYRKTPFLQVGADIYCDSSLICDVLEHVQPEPTLYPPHLKGVSRVFAQWADTTLFWAAMAYNLQPKGAQHVFAKAPPEAAKAFGEDRKAMSANMIRLRPGDATSAYRSYLRRIAHMVEEHDFLFGTDPCVADFAAYHALWYTRVQVPVLADILAATPAVGEWMDRLAATGHGIMDKFNSADAITVAKNAEPEPAGNNLLIDHGRNLRPGADARRPAGRHTHALHLAARGTACGHRPRALPADRLRAAQGRRNLRRWSAMAAATGFCLFDTAIGACGLAWDADGKVAGSLLPEANEQKTRNRMRRHYPQAVEREPPPALQEVVRRVRNLLDGQADPLLDVALDMADVPQFNQRVYAVTRAIPPGRTLTYGEVAAQIGEPGAARAVGQALGHNPFAPIVPCHRVLAAGQAGGGFSAEGGVATKLRMLQIECARFGNEPGLFD
jgi:O-6-methylguanine DNA methyltransferase